MNYLQVSVDEKVTSILPMPKELKNSTLSLAMITRNGTIKKSSAENFKDVRRSGLISIKLDEGDVLLSAGIIAFFGFFPPFYRETCLTSWKNLLKEYNIVFSANFTFQNILSDPIKLSKLINEEHLPNDDFSIDNALLVENCEHWPLLIDPQKQGSIWIKEKEKGK